MLSAVCFVLLAGAAGSTIMALFERPAASSGSRTNTSRGCYARAGGKSHWKRYYRVTGRLLTVNNASPTISNGY